MDIKFPIVIIPHESMKSPEATWLQIQVSWHPSQKRSVEELAWVQRHLVWLYSPHVVQVRFTHEVIWTWDPSPSCGPLQLWGSGRNPQTCSWAGVVVCGLGKQRGLANRRFWWGNLWHKINSLQVAWATDCSRVEVGFENVVKFQNVVFSKTSTVSIVPPKKWSHRSISLPVG